MSSTPSVTSTAPTAKSFGSFEDFLRSNPQTKNLIEQSVRTGSVCSINLSDLPLDIELDAQPIASESTTITRKVK